MTEAQFIFMHTSGIRNAGTNLHLNITTVNQVGRVSSIVIGQQALQIDNNTTDTDLNNVLEQVEQIQFTFIAERNLGQPDVNLEFNIPITNKAYYNATSYDPFFYFQFEDILINPATQYTNLNNDYQVLQVNLTPFLLDIQFGFSEYNALIGNALDNRKSKLRVESNRTEDSVLPTNWQAIMSGSAFPATIQDSLYYDTGWVRGRYNGAKITATGNSSVAPAINGTPFQGEIFTYDADDIFICSTTREKVVIEDMLHTSTQPLPSFVSSSVKDEDSTDLLLGNLIDQGNGEFRIDIFGGSSDNTPYPPLQPGDILSSENDNTPPLEFELFRVNYQDGAFVYVERGYNSSPQGTHTSTPLYKLERYDLFKFEEGTTEYLRLINDAKVYVQGNNTIVNTDKYGNVVSEVKCT